jgi:hypothetical protein
MVKVEEPKFQFRKTTTSHPTRIIQEYDSMPIHFQHYKSQNLIKHIIESLQKKEELLTVFFRRFLKPSIKQPLETVLLEPSENK